MSPVERIAEALEGRQSGDGWICRCPCHADQHHSLSVANGTKGQAVVVKCHAGCTQEAVIAELKARDLWPNNVDGYIPRNNTATLQHPCTLEHYAEAKKLPVEFLKGLGLSDTKNKGTPAVRIPYRDRGGAEPAVRFRIALDGKDRFRWRGGSKPCLYGLWRLDKPTFVILVEGESDCHTLWYHEIPALGIPGAASWKEARDAGCLDDLSTIYVIVEPDKGGEAVKRWLAKSAIRDRVRLVSLPAKDPSELYLADSLKFRERLQAALDIAELWRDYEAREADSARRTAWAQCQSLAKDPAILERFVQDFRCSGVVGEERAGKLLYLVVTSRFLPRPVSAAIKGPSAGGKSYMAEQVLKFFPERANYALSAMSERALAYSEEPLQHRFLVIYEAAGLASDFASYLMRSLLSEGRLAYETVEKTAEGLKARLIVREGPTGLIVTTTQLRLHPENETRLISIPVTDTQDQTRAVLRSLAGGDDGPLDLQPWIALQTWLEHAGHRVLIPYAEELAEKIPPVAVRLRRDFGAILALIRAHAILHQASRPKAHDGSIIARIEDYRVVRELVADLVAEGVEASVPESIRETVKAVEKLAGDSVSIGDLAKRLHLDKSTTSRRVRAALDRGYLKNLEDKKGRPARLVVSDPLPDELVILPDPEVLQCCSVVRGGIPNKAVSSADNDGSPGTSHTEADNIMEGAL